VFRFERKSEPLAPVCQFLLRLRRCFAITLGIVAFSLGLGTTGYHYLADLGWVDALYNAAMILTGMGPSDKPSSTAGKLFATFYALYSGIAFLTLVAILLAPVYHRFLHQFHLSEEDDDDVPATAAPTGPVR
jgi:hypothetical protein